MSDKGLGCLSIMWTGMLCFIFGLLVGGSDANNQVVLIKKQAVEKKYAEWTVNEHGITEWRWK